MEIDNEERVKTIESQLFSARSKMIAGLILKSLESRHTPDTIPTSTEQELFRARSKMVANIILEQLARRSV